MVEEQEQKRLHVQSRAQAYVTEVGTSDALDTEPGDDGWINVIDPPIPQDFLGSEVAWTVLDLLLSEWGFEIGDRQECNQLGCLRIRRR